MLKDIIENEIEYEKRLLDKVLGKLDGLAFMSLVASEDKKGRMRFFYYDRTLRKRKYIKDSEKKLLRDITTARFLGRRRAILQGNIMSLTEALKSLNEYDSQTIIDALPKAYKLSISKLNLNFDDGVPFIDEADNIIICKVLYKQLMKEDCVVNGRIIADYYDKGDYHYFYIAEIKKVMIR